MNATKKIISTKKLVWMALFIALSVVGANIKVMGSIAFDSLPAFVAALMLGPVWGAVTGALGHFLTALTSGFPLTLPVHLLTCLTMGLTMVAFYYAKKLAAKSLPLIASLVIAVIVGALMNGPVSLLILSPLLVPLMGTAGIFALLPTLTLVGGLNAALGAVVYWLLPTSITGDKRPK